MKKIIIKTEKETGMKNVLQRKNVQQWQQKPLKKKQKRPETEEEEKANYKKPLI